MGNKESYCSGLKKVIHSKEPVMIDKEPEMVNSYEYLSAVSFMNIVKNLLSNTLSA